MKYIVRSYGQRCSKVANFIADGCPSRRADYLRTNLQKNNNNAPYINRIWRSAHPIRPRSQATSPTLSQKRFCRDG